MEPYEPSEVRRRIENILRPGGEYIGVQGTGRGIRVVRGGEGAAEEMFERILEVGESFRSSTYGGTLVRLSEVGFVGYRPPEESKPATLDVNIAGMRIKEIKFVE